MKLAIIKPSVTQLRNCKRWGWIYCGDGLFEHPEKGWIGYFTETGFKKE